MALGFPFAHIPSGFAEDGHRGHNINPVDPGQVRTRHAKQLRAQVELRLIAFVLPEPSLSLLFRQTGSLAPILCLGKILLQLLITLSHLPLTKLLTILFLS